MRGFGSLRVCATCGGSRGGSFWPRMRAHLPSIPPPHNIPSHTCCDLRSATSDWALSPPRLKVSSSQPVAVNDWNLQVEAKVCKGVTIIRVQIFSQNKAAKESLRPLFTIVLIHKPVLHQCRLNSLNYNTGTAFRTTISISKRSVQKSSSLIPLS